MKPYIEIAGRPIGPGYPTYIVAELSANHGHRVEEALRLIDLAKDAGADAVKLQTYTPDTMTLDAPQPHFQIAGGLWGGRTLYDLYREAHTPWAWHPQLVQAARDRGLTVFSTPFDSTAVEYLEQLGVPAYKLASFELVDIPLIRRVARTCKPIIMSTGMGSLAEIDEAVRAFRDEGNDQLLLLHCVSAYPAPPEEMNLRTIPHLSEMFGVPVGLSDHTLGSAVAVAAVSLGACCVEKHFISDRSLGGPDATFSIEPAELRGLVDSVRVVEKAIGRVSYARTQHEEGSLVFRRSLFVVADVQRGEMLSEANVRAIRPGHGLAPKYLGEILGRRAARDIARGTPLSWDLVQ